MEFPRTFSIKHFNRLNQLTGINELYSIYNQAYINIYILLNIKPFNKKTVP